MSLDPDLVMLHGDLDHLQGIIQKQLGGAVHSLGAAEMKAAVDCAMCFQAKRVWNVDVAAPRCAVRTPCHRDVGSGEPRHGHHHQKVDEKEAREPHAWA